MSKTLAAVALLIVSALSCRADGMNFIAQVSISGTLQSELTVWTFTEVGDPKDPFSVTHTFTDVTVYPWGGWLVGGIDEVSVNGEPLPVQWMGEVESFTDTPVPSPSTWDLTLLKGPKGQFDSEWSLPVTSPEPPTLALLGSGLFGIAWLAWRRRGPR